VTDSATILIVSTASTGSPPFNLADKEYHSPAKGPTLGRHRQWLSRRRFQDKHREEALTPAHNSLLLSAWGDSTRRPCAGQ